MVSSGRVQGMGAVRLTPASDQLNVWAWSRNDVGSIVVLVSATVVMPVGPITCTVRTARRNFPADGSRLAQGARPPHGIRCLAIAD